MRTLHAFFLSLAGWAALADGQVEISGRIVHPRAPGGEDVLPFTAITCFGNLAGAGSEGSSFRTWELEPAGWYRITGPEGNWTLLLSAPGFMMRPCVRTNVFCAAGEKSACNVRPSFDFACFAEAAWDPKAATHYWQTFVARGTAVTQVGFRLVHDGVDGPGPGAQTVLVSLHAEGAGTPDTWAQVGPTAHVFGVDCGGPKNYIWSAGWNSGEVPLTPGRRYAVHITAETPGNVLQAFWREDADRASDCYRTGPSGPNGFVGRDLWLAVATDGDGLKIPYNKRVQKPFGEFAGFRKAWAQTYVAQGRSLAGVILYAAVSGAQPPLTRQRACVRVKRGGPDGTVVGVEKIAVGNGNWTGDASWGMFGAAYAPGEVPLVPGERYAIELCSIEHYGTLHGFVNIKGQTSDDRPGFNPYRKVAPDAYAGGTAYANGIEAVDFDLDMQIIEYERAVDGEWAGARDERNLLGDRAMEGWAPFRLAPATVLEPFLDPREDGGRLLRVTEAPTAGAPIDGGYVRRVENLAREDTYVLTGKVRASWPLDTEHECAVGIDSTGQTANPGAATIAWTRYPLVHGVFTPLERRPVRPVKDAISIWLRGKTAKAYEFPFTADWGAFALERVRTDAP